MAVQLYGHDVVRLTSEIHIYNFKSTCINQMNHRLNVATTAIKYPLLLIPCHKRLQPKIQIIFSCGAQCSQLKARTSNARWDSRRLDKLCKKVIFQCLKNVSPIVVGETFVKRELVSRCRSQFTNRPFTAFCGQMWMVKQELISKTQKLSEV